MITPLNVYVPYEDFINAQQDSAKLASIIAILETEFPDDTCQLIAIKSVLGIVEEEEEEEEEPTNPDDPTTDPVDPNPDTPDPDPTDPPTGGDPDPTP